MSKKIKDSARDEICTLQVAGVCNHRPETTVLAHIKTEGGSIAKKAEDYSAVYACYACHTWLDQHKGTKEDELFYTRRGLIRTWRRLIEKGLVILK